MRGTTIALILPIAFALGTACNQKEQGSQCWDARQKSRDAIVQDKLDEAQKLLEHARNVCSGQSADDIRRIEGQLADRRETARAIAKEAAQDKRAHDFPTQQFIRWATEPVEQFLQSLSNVKCAERGDPAYGFCEAERKTSPNMTVRYWDHDRKAVRYQFRTNLPLECEDLGDHRLVRRWSQEGRSYELCELTAREARDLSALLIRDSGDNRMYIFSFAYLQKDPAFELGLRRPGASGTERK